MRWSRGGISCWWRRPGGVVRGAVPAVRDQPRYRLSVAAALAGGRRRRARRAVARAPRSNARAVAPELIEARLALRRQHPTRGPVKVKAALERRHSGWLWPAASTIGELFAREGLTARRKRRRRTPPGGPLFAADAPNDVWAVDFKGWFRTGDGARCDTLTLADACSRYLLRCQAVAHPDTGHVWPILDAAFREHGLPLRLRSDNGPPPFATAGAGGLSRLAVMVIKAGVLPERPRQAAGERPARAAAPDTLAGHGEPAGGEPPGPGEAVPGLPADLQRGAAARRPRQRHTGPAPCAVAAALGRPPALARARGRRHAAGEEQRGDLLARDVRLRQRGARRRAGRTRRDRRRSVEGALRFDPARHPRRSRRPAEPAGKSG